MFAFVHVEANSKEMFEEMSFPSFFQKNQLMSTFLLRLKANYLEKMRGYPYFSLWSLRALSNIYFFRVVLKLLYLVGSVLNFILCHAKMLK